MFHLRVRIKRCTNVMPDFEKNLGNQGQGDPNVGGSEQKFICDICRGPHHTEEHHEVGESGIELVHVSKLIPGIKPERTGWPERPRFLDPGWEVRTTFGAGNLVREEIGNREKGKLLLKNLEGQVVVDLGAGRGDAYLVAAANRAKGYVGVEPFNYKNLKGFLMETPSESDEHRYAIHAFHRVEEEDAYKDAG